jgi:hypothetical protein
MCGTRRGSLWSAQLLWGCCSHSRLSGAWVSGQAVSSFSSHISFCLHVYNNDYFVSKSALLLLAISITILSFLSRLLEATFGVPVQPPPAGSVSLDYESMSYSQMFLQSGTGLAEGESLDPKKSQLSNFLLIHRVFQYFFKLLKTDQGLGRNGTRTVIWDSIQSEYSLQVEIQDTARSFRHSVNSTHKQEQYWCHRKVFIAPVGCSDRLDVCCRVKCRCRG